MELAMWIIVIAISLLLEFLFFKRHAPVEPLTRRQKAALDRALRTLDLRNDYEVGDALRVAFGVELDGLKGKR